MKELINLKKGILINYKINKDSMNHNAKNIKEKQKSH